MGHDEIIILRKERRRNEPKREMMETSRPFTIPI